MRPRTRPGCSRSRPPTVSGSAASSRPMCIAIRELYPSREASWRVPSVLFVSMGGMAFGGWWAGALYDHFGFYAPAFVSGVLFNLANIAVVGFLVLRQRRSGGLCRRHAPGLGTEVRSLPHGGRRGLSYRFRPAPRSTGNRGRAGRGSGSRSGAITRSISVLKMSIAFLTPGSRPRPRRKASGGRR